MSDRLIASASILLAAAAVGGATVAIHRLAAADLAVAGLTAASTAAMLRASTDLQRLASLLRRKRETS